MKKAFDLMKRDTVELHDQLEKKKLNDDSQDKDPVDIVNKSRGREAHQGMLQGDIGKVGIA